MVYLFAYVFPAASILIALVVGVQTIGYVRSAFGRSLGPDDLAFPGRRSEENA